MKLDQLRDEMSKLSTFAARNRFCQEHFTQISTGSARRAFDMGDGRVLKLAINQKGLDQNPVETDYGLGHMYPEILNPPLDHCDEDWRWMIAPKLEKARKKELEEYLGVDLPELNRFLSACEDERDGRRSHFNFETHEDNETLSLIQDLVFNTNLRVGDWSRPSSWGKDPESGDFKILDWGLDKAVFEKHYAPKPKRSAYGMGY